MVQVVSIDQLIDRFLDLPAGEIVYVDIGGAHPLPIKASPSQGARSLVVSFHGAANRDKRPYPQFLNFREGIDSVAHQISITDATLGLDDKLAIGWYAGAPGLLLQKLLPPFFEQLKQGLGIERVVFVGSSGGGFGALYYSWHCSGSVAVVQVPQTNVWKYHLPGALRRYERTCWPGELETHENAPVLDLREIYNKGSSNSIVYIQSTLDTHHLHDQMIPFLAALTPEMRERTVVKSSYWGRPGHSNVVPMREWDGWLKAALMAEELTAEGIVESYSTLGVEKTPKVGKQASATQPSEMPRENQRSRRAELNQQDFYWADVVANAQLGNGKR